MSGVCCDSQPDLDEILMLLTRDISVSLDTNPCTKIIKKGVFLLNNLFISPIFQSLSITPQVHRVWRVQRELLRDKSRLDTLRPLQE